MCCQVAGLQGYGRGVDMQGEVCWCGGEVGAGGHSSVAG